MKDESIFAGLASLGSDGVTKSDDPQVIDVAALLARSAKGEAVMDILVSMGINPYDGTDWLQKHRQAEVVAAKKEQIRGKQ